MQICSGIVDDWMVDAQCIIKVYTINLAHNLRYKLRESVYV